jgi:hypothetical protein
MVEDPANLAEAVLAARFRREVYLLSFGNASQWQAVQPIQWRLKVGEKETQAALTYAVAIGWLEAQGEPIFRVRLTTADFIPE